MTDNSGADESSTGHTTAPGEEGQASLDSYRDAFKWDATAWGTHCLNCLGTCPYRVYVKDGEVLFEEPGGNIEAVSDDVPDMNPLGCQKGCSWSAQLYGEDRILSPLKRTGERGEGSWEEVSWDQALTEIADAIIDAIDDEGPESVVFEETVEGGLAAWAAYLRFASLIGAVTLDANGLINDFPTGQHMTFGKFACASTADDTFHSKLILIWHANPAYTSIPYFHFIPEARYAGAKVITIAPDYSPSAVGADEYVSVIPGTDAALALSMTKVVLDEGIADYDFIKSQTDLPFAVIKETGRFLRGTDIDPSEYKDDQFFWLDSSGSIIPAPRGSLDVSDAAIDLEAVGKATLSDGTEAELTTVFSLLRERLQSFTPEAASEMCGVAPSTIEHLAKLAAANSTKIIEGFNAAKYYHGDLMERSMCLLLAVTGNWGRPGAGIQGLALAGMDGYMLFPMKQRRGLDETARVLDGVEGAMEALKEQDPDASDEIVGLDLLSRGVAAGSATPPVFFNYYHGGYEEPWNNSEWGDPTMKRTFDEYFRDAIGRGWWGGLVRPDDVTDPQVFFCVGTNPLRRSRGGRKRFLETLWPNLETIVTVDNRMSSTAAWSDYVLPAAMQYERPNLQYAVTHTFRLAFSDAAIEPRGDSKTEWEIFKMLSQKVQERAIARDFVEFQDGRRQTKRLDDIAEQFTYKGAFETDEVIVDEWIRDCGMAGTLPDGVSIERMRETGSMRFTGLGIFASGLAVAADAKKDEPLNAYSWHTEKHVPFPTLTRRAQFYIDHPWFIEADEALPTHKAPPNAGGNKPFALTSGHSRWTVHAVSMGNRMLLETHRAGPLVVINAHEASERSITDGSMVKVFNDHGDFEAPAKLSGRIRPGQVVVYNGFEPHMFKDWKGQNEVEPGLVKWLHLVARYGHLRYLPFGWQPVPSDRAVRVDIAPAEAGS